MDRYKNEQQHLKAGRFSRSYKDACGCNYHDDIKTKDKFPWIVFLVCVILLIAIY